MRYLYILLGLFLMSFVSAQGLVAPVIPQDVNVSNATSNDTTYCDGVLCSLYWQTDGSNGPATGDWDLGSNSLNNVNTITTSEGSITSSGGLLSFSPTSAGLFGVGTSAVISQPGLFYPVTDNTVSLGASTRNWIDGWFSGTVYANVTNTSYLIPKVGSQIHFREDSTVSSGQYMTSSSSLLTFTATSGILASSSYSISTSGQVTLNSLINGVSNGLTINSNGNTFEGIVNTPDGINVTNGAKIYFFTTLLGDDAESTMTQNTFFGLDQFRVDLDANGDLSGFSNTFTGDGTNFLITDQLIRVLASGLPSLSTQLTDTTVGAGNIAGEFRTRVTDSGVRDVGIIANKITGNCGSNTNDCPSEWNFHTQSAGSGDGLFTPRMTIEDDGEILIRNNLKIDNGDVVFLDDSRGVYFGGASDVSTIFNGVDLVTQLLIGSTAKASWQDFAEYDFDNDVVIDGGHLNQTGGNATINMVYGELWLHDGLVVDLVTVDVAENLTGLNSTWNNGFEWDGSGTLMAMIPGLYSTTWSSSFSGSANSEYEMGVGINGNHEGMLNGQSINKTHSHRTIGTGGQVGSFGGNGNLCIIKNDNITMMIADNSAPAQDATITNVQLNLLRIGDC